MKNDSRAAIEAVKSRFPIVDLIGRYLALRRAGAEYVGLCPFHNERTPSFSVSPEKGLYYCRGCHAAGDAIGFYCRINGLDFREGLEQMAREVGIALAEYKPDPQEEHRRRLKQAAGDMHALARDHYRDNLRAKQGEAAREYLTRRGVAPEMAERFQLGYSLPDFHGLQNFLRRKGFSDHDGVAAGLYAQGDDGRVWDRFRDRLMFPIHEVSGRVVAFGGRVMGQGEPKYLNSSDSVLYKKSDHLFGLSQARPWLAKSGRALLSEGYLDVIAMHQHGFTEAVGVLGTALTPQQVKRLTGFAREVLLVFDGDAAGRKAALKSARMLLLQGAQCRVALLPEGEDADSLLTAHGADAFRSVLEQAREGLDFCLSTVRQERSAKEAVDWALEFLQGLDSDIVRAGMLTRLAHGLGLGEHELRTLAASRSASRSGGDRVSGQDRPARPAPVRAEAKRDAQILEFAIRVPDALPEMERLGVFSALSTERARAFWRLLCQYEGSQVLPYLDDKQKRFWGQCASKEPLADDEARRWWEDITALTVKGRDEEHKRHLIEAMRLAREQGDGEALQRHMAAFSELVGRNQ